MATLQTTNDFREAIRYLQSINHFGAVILQVNVGDTVAECEVLDDDTLTDITPDTATLESALDSANAENDVQVQESAQASSARANLQTLMTGLHGLSAEDKSYAIACRIMAHKDGASNQTIMGIVDRPTAVAYITGKPEWAGATAATRALVGDVLEMTAGICQVLLLVLTG